jgi:hypothetical protein
MTATYKVVGTNGAHDGILNAILSGQLEELSKDFYSFIVGGIDYDLEIQDRKNIGGKDYLFCWLTSDENCGRVVLEII